jgi:hypothetical protein
MLGSRHRKVVGRKKKLSTADHFKGGHLIRRRLMMNDRREILLLEGLCARATIA